MRAAPLTLAFLALLLPAATAQEDGCSQSQPCPWPVDVDETGILSEGRNATVGDWYKIEAFNLDDERAHTLTLEGYDVTLTVPAGGEAISDPIQFDTLGTFSLDDHPTDDFVLLEVRATDVVDDETSAGGDGDDGADDDAEDTPLPLAVGLAAVVAAAVLRRR